MREKRLRRAAAGPGRLLLRAHSFVTTMSAGAAAEEAGKTDFEQRFAETSAAASDSAQVRTARGRRMRAAEPQGAGG